MADISDVEDAILSLLTQIVYPQGSGTASALIDRDGKARDVQLYRGWPIPDQLDADMKLGKVNVSIFPMRVEVNTTRYGLDFQDVLPLPAPTLTLTAAAGSGGRLLLEDGGFLLLEDGLGDLLLEGDGITLTVGGTVEVPQNVAVIVNGFGYSYGVQANDTLTSIATGLAALINADIPATSSGAEISIPSAFSVKPRVGVYGNSVQEVARQKRNVMISLWCSTPDLRDAAAKLFDASLKSTTFLNLVDGTQCRIIYVSSPITDMTEKQNCYRRDLIYSFEYGTTISIQAAEIIIEPINLTGGIDPTAPAIETTTA